MLAIPNIITYIYLKGKDNWRHINEGLAWKFISEHESYKYSTRDPVRRKKLMDEWWRENIFSVSILLNKRMILKNFVLYRDYVVIP